jgi:hypothetical protein
VEFPEVYQKCLAYGAPSQPSLRRMEPGQKLSHRFRDTLIVVSVNIVSIPLYINIVLISLFCCCMCRLPRRTYNECLVFFGKPSVTVELEQ